MKVKPIGKIAIIAILALVAFLGIRHYQAAHPTVQATSTSPVSVAADSVKNAKIDSVVVVFDKPIIEHSKIPSKKSESPAPHETKPKEHKQPAEKKKDGERKNLDLNNF